VFIRKGYTFGILALIGFLFGVYSRSTHYEIYERKKKLIKKSLPNGRFFA